MKIMISWLLIGVGLLVQSAIGGTVLGVEGRTCYPPSYDPFLTTVVAAYGDRIDRIDRAITGATGVTISIVGKFTAAQNNTGPFAGKGKVTLRIKILNASPGIKTINLIDDLAPLSGGVGTFSFPITVVGPPTVTSTKIPAPSDPFNEIILTLPGTGLNGAKDPASGTIVTDAQNTLVTVGPAASVSSVRVLSSTATSLQVQIFFTAPVQAATVELSLHSDDPCVPLGVLPVTDGVTLHNDPAFKTRVRVGCAIIRNYVTSIGFPQRTTFDKNSTGTINLNLLFPSPGAPPPPTDALTVSSNDDPGNSTVYFKLLSATAFARPDGTPFPTDSEGFIVATVPAGQTLLPISFKVVDCLGTQPGSTKPVEIQTWMHDFHTIQSPDFIQARFSVRCGQ